MIILEIICHGDRVCKKRHKLWSIVTDLSYKYNYRTFFVEGSFMLEHLTGRDVYIYGCGAGGIIAATI